MLVRDVTQAEDKSRIRTKPLPQIMALLVFDALRVRTRIARPLGI
jgi:hypothetical protein